MCLVIAGTLVAVEALRRSGLTSEPSYYRVCTVLCRTMTVSCLLQTPSRRTYTFQASFHSLASSIQGRPVSHPYTDCTDGRKPNWLLAGLARGEGGRGPSARPGSRAAFLRRSPPEGRTHIIEARPSAVADSGVVGPVVEDYGHRDGADTVHRGVGSVLADVNLSLG